MISGVVNNEDVLFQWCMLSVELDDKIAIQLRDMIIELYVTVRGYAFANSCMEQSKKKTTQKSKGTRSKISQ